MSYRIVLDSAGELTEELKADEHIGTVPFTLLLDGVETVDDDTFDQMDYLKRVADSKNCPKSQCPSPVLFVDAMESDAENIYIITISSQLSGSYNSAQAAREMYLEDHPDCKIHIVDSKSTSIGMTLIAQKITELENEGLSFEEIVDKVEAYRDSQVTYFVLETLETLRKNGRLSNLKSVVASVLNIKPVMGSTPEGTIQQLSQARGINKALEKMIATIVLNTPEPEKKVVGICQCNCPERAEKVKNDLLAMQPFKEVFIVPAAGISSTYANDGGIIVVV